LKKSCELAYQSLTKFNRLGQSPRTGRSSQPCLSELPAAFTASPSGDLEWDS
jgi:hypothetical protein